jgi:predicted metalloenzyme YecM
MAEFLGDPRQFIETTSVDLAEVGIQREELIQMDHICYRVEDENRYRVLKAMAQTSAELVAENQVNGREISTFEFYEPLGAAGWTVPYLELPAPKAGAAYEEGWEHVELVTSGSLERFLQRHRELPFSYDGMNKLINPEAGLKMGRLCVKFHEQPLGAVARIEQRLEERGVRYDI